MDALSEEFRREQEWSGKQRLESVVGKNVRFCGMGIRAVSEWVQRARERGVSGWVTSERVEVVAACAIFGVIRGSEGCVERGTIERRVVLRAIQQQMASAYVWRGRQGKPPNSYDAAVGLRCVSRALRAWVTESGPRVVVNRFVENGEIQRLRRTMGSAWPMRVEPLPWTHGEGGGWISLRMPLCAGVSKRQAALLKPENWEQVESFVNRLQRVPWRLSEAGIAVMERVWKEGGGLGLPPKGDPEKPGNAGITRHTEGYEDVKWARRLWKRECRSRRQRRAQWALSERRILESRNQDLYFPRSMDFRGRVYDRVPTLSWQAPEWCRSVLTLSQERESPWSECAEDLALYGYELWNGERLASPTQRMQWLHEGADRFVGWASNPGADLGWQQAKKPLLFLAFCRALRDVLKHGRTREVIRLDATASGLQIVAALTGDFDLARASNLFVGGDPKTSLFRDPYGEFAGKMTGELLRETSPALEWWLRFYHEGEPGRKLCKYLLLSLTFGLTEHGARRMIREFYWDRLRAVERDPFDKGHSGKEQFEKLVGWYLFHARVPLTRCQRLHEALTIETDARWKKGDRLEWTTRQHWPVVVTGFNARPTVRLSKTLAIPLSNSKRGVKAAAARASLAHLTHSLDASILHGMDLPQDLPFATAHDALWGAPGDARTLRSAYARSFTETMVDARARILPPIVGKEVLGEDLPWNRIASQARLLK